MIIAVAVKQKIGNIPLKANIQVFFFFLSVHTLVQMKSVSQAVSELR